MDLDQDSYIIFGKLLSTHLSIHKCYFKIDLL